MDLDPEGWDSNLFVEVVDEQLLCGICSEVLRDCMETPCGHSFCKLCLRTWLAKKNICPIEQSVVSFDKCHPMIRDRRRVLSLKVQCEFEPCKEQMPLAFYPQHRRGCAHRPVDWIDPIPGQHTQPEADLLNGGLDNELVLSSHRSPGSQDSRPLSPTTPVQFHPGNPPQLDQAKTAQANSVLAHDAKLAHPVMIHSGAAPQLAPSSPEALARDEALARRLQAEDLQWVRMRQQEHAARGALQQEQMILEDALELVLFEGEEGYDGNGQEGHDWRRQQQDNKQQAVEEIEPTYCGCSSNFWCAACAITWALALAFGVLVWYYDGLHNLGQEAKTWFST